MIIGKYAPDFTAKAVMSDNTIDSCFNLYSYAKGFNCVLFFYPLDFTFVCPSEIIALQNRLQDFSALHTKIVAISVDSVFSHRAWKNIPYDKGGIYNVQFPLVSDLNKDISKSYGVLSHEGVAFRGTFIIDEDFIVRHASINDMQLGRNIDEIIRTIHAIQHHKKEGEVCPAGWVKNAEAIVPSASGIESYLTSHAGEL